MSMSDDEDEVDRRLFAIFWVFCSGVLAIAFAIGGYSLSAFAIALSGVLAFPALAEVWGRYGLTGRNRMYVGIGITGLAVFAYLVVPSPKNAEVTGGSAEFVASEDVESNDDVEPDDSVEQFDQSGQDLAAAPEVIDCRAIDGDTLDCLGETVRLLGIDAPEMPGHCALGRVCVPGDPYVSRSSLEAALKTSMKIVRVGQDRFDRTLAIVYADGANLSCYQLASNQAAYVGEWDDGGRVRNECPGH